MSAIDLETTQAGRAISVLLGQPDDIAGREVRAKLQASDGSFVLAGEASSGTNFLDLAALIKPDVVLLRGDLADLGRADVIARLKDRSPDTKVIVITKIDDDTEILSALCAGADGYYIPDVTGDQLATAIAAVRHGSVCMHPTILQRLSDLCPFPYRSRMQEEPSCFGLSNRELQVLSLLIDGCSNREIGQRLDVSLETVKTHLR